MPEIIKSAVIEELISLYGSSLYSFCMRLTDNREDGDDLYQETFLKAFLLCKEGRISTDGNPKAFLFSLAVGLRKNQKRKAARRHRIAPTYSMEDTFAEQQDFKQSVEDEVIKKEQAEKLKKCISGLPEKQKIPILLLYGEDYTVGQIAEICGCPEGTVKSRLNKARGLLKKEMEEFGYGI